MASGLLSGPQAQVTHNNYSTNGVDGGCFGAHLAEDYVLAIQPVGLGSADEKPAQTWLTRGNKALFVLSYLLGLMMRCGIQH